MEFLLVNHPLDCPICDQGGECDLQVRVKSNLWDIALFTYHSPVIHIFWGYGICCIVLIFDLISEFSGRFDC